MLNSALLYHINAELPQIEYRQPSVVFLLDAGKAPPATCLSQGPHLSEERKKKGNPYEQSLSIFWGGT